MTYEDQIAAGKQRAKSMCIEQIVRTIARTGIADQAGINFHAEFDGKYFRATDGAGTNSASVRVAAHDITLYASSDFGRHVEAFRPGPWVQRATTHADDIAAQREREEAEQERRKMAEIAAKFADFDD